MSALSSGTRLTGILFSELDARCVGHCSIRFGDFQ